MKQIPFRIVDIKVEKFELTNTSFSYEEKVEVRTGFEFGVNVDKHVVQCRATYIYLQRSKELLNLVLTSFFDVKPEEFVGLLNDNSFIIEPYFSQYLATINVGAARGEIHARCEIQESPLANVILPPINLTQVLNSNIEIILQNQQVANAD